MKMRCVRFLRNPFARTIGEYLACLDKGIIMKEFLPKIQLSSIPGNLPIFCNLSSRVGAQRRELHEWLVNGSF
jgi:hypothetical protein